MPRPVFGIVSDEEEDVEEVDARRSCTKYTDNVYHVEWEMHHPKSTRTMSRTRSEDDK